ncbi:hypothetical protein GCM10022268_08950 [Sphingomonas cynarae]|uniref:Uncharacterized protein n=2 Tax=Sphingomonas cynarae TaxID=930197 RepID=A0ABP7D9C7_9SPHN
MGPDAGSGFSFFLFTWLCIAGLGNPVGIAVGIGSGLVMQRWWTAGMAGFVALLTVESILGHDWSAGRGAFNELTLGMSIAAAIWAIVVRSIRHVTRSDDRL